MRIALLVCGLAGCMAGLVASLFFNAPVWASVYAGIVFGVVVLMFISILPDSWINSGQ